MKPASYSHGAASVGVLTDLDPLRLSAVLYMRLWCDGDRDRLQSDLTPGLGADAARRIGAEFNHLCTLCLRQGRRPLTRHHLQCKCLGADESCFAAMLRAAADGCDADAMMIATLMLNADQVPLSTALAQSVGQALARHAAQDFTPAQADGFPPAPYPTPRRHH